MSRCLPDEGGVDFRELGTTSPKLEDEFAPSLLARGKSKHNIQYSPFH